MCSHPVQRRRQTPPTSRSPSLPAGARPRRRCWSRRLVPSPLATCLARASSPRTWAASLVSAEARASTTARASPTPTGASRIRRGSCGGSDRTPFCSGRCRHRRTASRRGRLWRSWRSPTPPCPPSLPAARRICPACQLARVESSPRERRATRASAGATPSRPPSPTRCRRTRSAVPAAPCSRGKSAFGRRRTRGCSAPHACWSWRRCSTRYCRSDCPTTR
mmetsp:Transcript_2906/g.9838  ORF Transcript_2906/g.9838 Transcript_2906/m.9838 type:complete len:221 (+) Transcript_2906:4156-4818(+)